MHTCTVIGGGLAGSECALSLADRGVAVTLVEQRPKTQSPAHHTDSLAELVCSNSLKSEKLSTAAGLLKWELELLGSRLLEMAKRCRVPAGGSLAVDRRLFSETVTKAVESHPNITLVREEAVSIPEGHAVIAAGPLCSDALFEALTKELGEGSLSFFDAAAPIVDAESIDRSIAFAQSRYEKGEAGGDYLNCPMDREQYEAFIEELVAARKVIARDFEGKDLFCACQPVEEVARMGVDTLAHGALKPVGIVDPRSGERPWAVVQLRAENAQKTAYNLVGFQTNLAFPEQERVFRMIPGLENAEFLRYGVMHRNSFVDAPHVLEETFLIPGTKVRLAGQITGTEGYTEAIASGLLAALNTYCDMEGLERVKLPTTGALGSLVAYASDPSTVDYQPMHVQMGLMEPLPQHIRKKDQRRQRMVERAQGDLYAWKESRPELFQGSGV